MPVTRSKRSARLNPSQPATPGPPASRTRSRARAQLSKPTPPTLPSSAASTLIDIQPSNPLINRLTRSRRPDSPRPVALRSNPDWSGSPRCSYDQASPSSPSTSSSNLDNGCTSPSSISKPSLLDIPAEILDEICALLSSDVPSLLNLALVHPKLNAFASKTLYRAPIINSRYTAWRLRTGLRSRPCLPEYVRVLDIDLAKLCRASMWASWHLQETGGAFVDILSQCHDLVHFRVQMPKEASMFVGEFMTPIRLLSNLQTFYKDIRHDQEVFNETAYHRSSPPAWMSMPQLLAALGHLPYLHTVAVRGLGSTLSSRPIFKSQPIFANLRKLIIVQTSIKERDLQQLLRFKSGLVSLTLIESTCISKRGLVEALLTCGGALEELTIGPGWWGKSDTSYPLDDVVGTLPHLRKLSVEGDLLSPKFFSLTHTHKLRLDSLSVRRCQTLKPEATLSALKNMIELSPRLNPKRRLSVIVPIKVISLGNLFRIGWRHQDIIEASSICKPGIFDLGFDT